METRRPQRLNSLLKEVLTEVINTEVKNPHLPELVTITSVDITKDLKYAKVYVSVIGDEVAKQQALKALQSAAGFIAVKASKKVVMRYFPELTFKIDTSVDKQMEIESLISEVQAEREKREEQSEE